MAYQVATRCWREHPIATAFSCAFIFVILVLLSNNSFASLLPSVAPEVPPFFSIRAGVNNKSDVDAAFGVPVRQISTHSYEYRPMPDASDIATVVLDYFPDTGLVARVDAYLKTPLPAGTLRAQFGASAVMHKHTSGKQEEIFFPRLNGLLYAPDAPDMAVAVTYLSRRALADGFADTFNQDNEAERSSEAREDADNAVTADPDYARAYVTQGIYYFDQHNIDEALVRFVAATRAKYTARKQAHAHAWIGDIYWQEKKLPEKAIKEYQAALSLAPDYDIPHLQYAHFLHAQQQLDQAIVEFTHAIRLNSAGMEARETLAWIHYERKEWGKASVHLSALSDWADSAAAANADAQKKSNLYRGYAYSLSQNLGPRSTLDANDATLKKIILAYEKAFRLKPNDPVTCFNLGLEYERAGNLERAASLYRAGLNAAPKDAHLSQGLENVLRKLGR